MQRISCYQLMIHDPGKVSSYVQPCHLPVPASSLPHNRASTQALPCPAGDQIYSTEVQRWCPDRDCFAATQDQLPTGQADVFEVCTSLQVYSSISTWLLDMQLHAEHKCTSSSECRCRCWKSLHEAAMCDSNFNAEQLSRQGM